MKVPQIWQQHHPKPSAWYQSAPDPLPQSSPKDSLSDTKYVLDVQEAVSHIQQSNSGNTSETQSSFVRRAFATVQADDSAQRDLLEEKKAEAAANVDPSIKQHAENLVGLEGWGSWTGEGTRVSNRLRKRRREAKSLLEAANKRALGKRKDVKMNSVLINEERDAKAAKFMCNSVPYPFTSREQYELAMRNPLGAEWNTTKSSSTLIRPSVIVPAGAIIKPVSAPSSDNQRRLRDSKRKPRF